MKAIIIILAFSLCVIYSENEIANARQAKKDGTQAQSIPKDTIKTVVNKTVDKVSVKVKDKDNKDVDLNYNKTKNDDSYRMIYEDDNKVIDVFRSTGYTSTRYKIFVGNSFEDCMKQVISAGIDTAKVPINFMDAE